METFLCPQCSSKPKASKKRAKPSHSEIEILLGALEQLDDVDRPRPKKKGWEPKAQAAKVTAFHLPEPTNFGRCLGIVGYLRNETHPTPTLGNGFLVPVTLGDIGQGYVATTWGVFRVVWQDGQLAATRDYSLKSLSKDSPLRSNSLSSEETSAPVGSLEVSRLEDSIQLAFAGLPEVTLPLFKLACPFSVPQDHLEKAMNVELKPEAVQKLMKERLKIKVNILGL
jgi:hypothetical protein